MAIYRGSGGSGSSTQDSYLNEVTAQAIIATTAANSTAGSAAATAADVLLTNADAVSTAADVLLLDQAVLDTAADVLLTAADAEATAADVLLTNADVAATADKLPKSGGALTGPITTNSTFDGRDVANDGTKLDTVEASADVTDATNVAAAGALMDSEVTNLADVKAFDTTDYATADQGTTADSALPKSGGTMTGVIADFESTGIDDTATSTLITVIDSAVGIGTATPTAAIQVALGGVVIPVAGAATAAACFGNDTSDDNYGLLMGADGTGKGYIQAQRTDGGTAVYDLAIQPNGGSVLVGTVTPANSTARLASHCQSGGISLETKSASDVYYPAIFYNTAGNAAGYISATSTTITYATSSDYRLKELDVPMTGATERVKALRPINFAWKVDGSRVDGFFAHELAEVVPEAATGTKDAMRDEEYEVTPATETDAAVMGTRSVPDYQAIDTSKIVPLLTAALQELIARVEELEA